MIKFIVNNTRHIPQVLDTYMHTDAHTHTASIRQWQGMNSWTHIINNLLSGFINGSLLPLALLNTILSEHCSYWGTDTDPIIFIGLWAYSTRWVLEYTSPVPLHCIVTVAFSGASPAHSNITCHDYDKYRTSIMISLVYQRKQWHNY